MKKSIFKVEWVDVRADLWQMDSTKNENNDGRYDVFGDSDADKKSQSGARGGRDADVKIFTGSAQNAQD